MGKALIIMDFINDIVHPEWKLSKKWYSKFIKENNTIKNINKQIKEFRENGQLIVFIKVWFQSDYNDQPKNSPLFGKANEFEVLKLWTWGTEFIEDLNHNKNDIVIIKNRVSPFYNTKLNNILKTNNIKELYLTGCATDLVVESTARDWHDRDYKINIIENCCAAANIQDHKISLNCMKKIAVII